MTTAEQDTFIHILESLKAIMERAVDRIESVEVRLARLEGNLEDYPSC